MSEKDRKFFLICETVGWTLLFSAIPFWFITKLPLSTTVLVVLPIAWIVGVRMDRKDLIEQKAKG